MSRLAKPFGAPAPGRAPLRIRRRLVVASIAVVVCSLFSKPGSTQTSPHLREAREALGGDAKLAGVRSLRFQGRAQILGVVNGVAKLGDPRSLDVRVLFPAKYLRIENDTRVETRAGFDGDELLNAVKSLRSDVHYGATYSAQDLKLERARFVRFVLGMLAVVPSVVPLEIRRGAGPGQVHASGPEDFDAVVDLDDRNVPVRVRYRDKVRFPQPGSIMPPAPETAEVTMTFEDRRPVNGISLAHRLVRTARDVVFEDLRFDTIAVNPPLAAADFRK